MSGSGGSVFGLFPDAEAAQAAAASIRVKSPEASVFTAKSQQA